MSNKGCVEVKDNESVKNVKDYILRTKLESAFESLAISKREFYQRAKISPAYWWRLSWGVDSVPLWFKKHLFREFGDCFAFLFEYKQEVLE